MFRRIFALIVKEFLAILKDPKSRFVVVAPPILQFFIYGYAATYDLKNAPYAVLDQSRTPASRDLLARFQAADAFRQVAELESPAEIEEMINNQAARLVLHIGPEFARDLQVGRTARVQVILDGRESNVALIALGYVNRIVLDFNRRLEVAQSTLTPAPRLRLDEHAWFNSNLQSRWFITSALGGIISMVVVMVLTSLSVAREREFGTFDQLLVAPFTPWEILAGKAIPPMTLGMAEGFLMSFAAAFWFGIPFRGSIAALAASLGLFVLAIVGVGLFISSLSRTMQQGLLGSFIFMMPAVILSGFTTPLANMPGWLEKSTRVNPMRYIVIALRRIALEGADIDVVWPQLWPLALIACVTLPVAGWFFRHRTS